MAALTPGYVIPRRELPASGGQGLRPHTHQPSPLDRAGRTDPSVLVVHCIYCRNDHDTSYYCFRGNSMPRKRGKRHSRESSDDSTDSEESDSEKSESSESSEEDEESEPGSEEGEETPAADGLGPASSKSALKEFYAAKKRVDARDVTCVLNSETLQLYFKTMVGEGKLDRDGADDIRNKYYLSSKQFNRLSPPSLSGTKLHMINNMEFGGLSEKLYHIHREHRTTAKLGLRLYELFAANGQAFKGLEQLPTHYETPEGEGPLSEFLLPTLENFLRDESQHAEDEIKKIRDLVIKKPENLEHVARELCAQRRMVTAISKQYLKVLDAKDTDAKVAALGIKLHEQGTGLMWDLLTLIGQEDLTIKETRESKLRQFLTPGFNSALKSSGRASLFCQTHWYPYHIKDLACYGPGSLVLLMMTFFPSPRLRVKEKEGFERQAPSCRH